jgi:hypothetical protein
VIDFGHSSPYEWQIWVNSVEKVGGQHYDCAYVQEVIQRSTGSAAG